MATASPAGKTPEIPDRHPGDPRWNLVLRIAASSQFRRATRLREFLLYICDKAVRGDVEGLHEHHIGCVVFERPATYSPAEDNVVRAHARQLRAKLAEYFAESGQDEPLVLEIPKGSYVPTFVRRAEHLQETADLKAAEAKSQPLQPTKLPLLTWVLGISTVILAACLIAVTTRYSRSTGTAPTGMADAAGPPLAWLFDTKEPATVVVADTSFGLLQDVLGHAASLDEYLSPEFNRKALSSAKTELEQRLTNRLTARQITSIADLLLSQSLERLGAAAGSQINVRPARDLHMRDLAQGNFIFLGSSYSNPWVSLFAKRRNFVIELDEQTHRGFVRNRAPRAGEARRYLLQGEDRGSGVTYAAISFLPAEAETGNVLIIEGINMEGTEAAGRYLTDSHEETELRRILRLRQNATPRPIEVVVETRVVAGASRDTRVVAARSGDG